jgi:hypothetical protein
MKNLFVRAAAALAGLAVLLWSLSCAPGTPPDKTMADPCTESNITNRIAKLEEHVKKGINADNGLANQHNANAFGFRVRQFNANVANLNSNAAEVMIAGKVVGEDRFDKVTRLLDKLQKKGCVQRIVLSRNTADLSLATWDTGFEWAYCEPGTCPGPGGECVMCSSTGTNNTTSNANANTNSNSNSNTNANSNSNTNSNTNSGAGNY